MSQNVSHQVVTGSLNAPILPVHFYIAFAKFLDALATRNRRLAKAI